jgi:hypothetical protein
MNNRFALPKNGKRFRGPHARAAGFCEHRAFASRASLCSTLAMLQGIKIEAHVPDFYGDFIIKTRRVLN